MKRALFAALLAAAACGKTEQGPPTVVQDDPSDVPVEGASAAERTVFAQGDRAFDQVFAAGDGLGPVFIRQSCGQCHAGAARGPGMVQKMSVVEANGLPSADQSALPYGHTVRPLFAGGGTKGVLPPSGGDLGSGRRVVVSTRAAPAVFGRGYLEAIADAEIERVAAAQAGRDDGIRGRINRVTFHSESNPDARFHGHRKGDQGLIGRFGLKARVATLDDFAADAFQGDMGLTTVMRPAELPNPDGMADDQKASVDVSTERLNAVAMYMRLLAIPQREPGPKGGAALFAAARCNVCHVESLKTRADYPIAALAGVDAPVYTDMLVHDMGEAADDSLPEESAGPRDFRTPPLIGLRLMRSYLHDGRAATLREAVEGHASPGSEANDSIARFRALSPADQQILIDFIAAL